MRYLVTVKLARNPEHDPHNKITGKCPVDPWGWGMDKDRICTDVTGQHHTFLAEGASVDDVYQMYARRHLITRIEEI